MTRLLEGGGRTFLLLEMRQILATTLQHYFVDRQDLGLHYVIFCKPHRPVDKAACLQTQLSRIVKVAIAGELEDESMRNRLKIVPEPINQIDILAFVQQDELSGNVNRRDLELFGDKGLKHLLEPIGYSLG